MITGLILTLGGAVTGGLIARATEALAEPKPSPPLKRRLWLPIAGALLGLGACVWGAWQDHTLLTMAFTALFLWQLLLIACVDAENHWLPDILTFPLGITGLIASLLLPLPFGQGWLASVLAAAFGFGALWLVSFVYRKTRGQSGLGGGDPILFGMGAAWVGFSDLMPVLFLASLLAALIAVGLKLRGHTVGRFSKLPFGTYLAVGFAIMWLIA